MFVRRVSFEWYKIEDVTSDLKVLTVI